MPINRCDPLVGAGLQQLGCHHLLHREHDAILASYADGCAAILHCLYRIFDLEVSAVGREDGVGQVVASSYRRLKESVSVKLHCGGRVQSWGLLTYHDEKLGYAAA
jgi:hypothetical protein